MTPPDQARPYSGVTRLAASCAALLAVAALSGCGNK